MMAKRCPLSDQNNEIVSCSEIIGDYLEAQGYDGLVHPEGDCACGVGDLMPCDGDFAMDCKAGYRDKCTCGRGCAFHIIPGKRPAK